MITTTGLTKIYRTDEIETTALDNINLRVDSGEFIAIMGPSGCGKTTLLNVLGMLDSPTAGEYRFIDTEVSGEGEGRRAALQKQHIGFVFQNFNLIEDLTVLENVELPLLYHRVPRRQRRERVTRLLERFKIVTRKDHYPRQLSGGQQQRVAVARAVVTNPALVLADEPTGNLDSTHGEEVMALLTALNEDGTTIMMVTHSPTYAGYANRVIHLFDGKIVTENLGRAQNV